MARPSDFKEAAKHACKVTMNNVETKYPNVRKNDLPYVCMDVVYQYTLLVNGFGKIWSMILEGLKPQQNITLVRQVQYGDSDFFGEAAWPLGSAIEAVTSEKINLKQF
ncbi:hypothetical protein BHE74_00020566 [Ensete ventricosum]|nr:hypothetical protein BHE74_00020566 [Ensete ventricosum]